jgi:hypothetical protein
VYRTHEQEEENMRTTKQRGMLVLVSLGVISVMIAGCAATRARRGKPEESGFLGSYAGLEKNPNYPAALVYVRPGVQWSRYNSIQIDSVGLWGNDTTTLSAEDQQKLTDALYEALYGQLSKYFVITNEPGPNTIRLRVALTQVQGAKVALRTITTVVPQLRLAGSLIGLAANTAATVGSATVEMEALDAVTDQRLAAAVDDRAGTKVLFAKRAYTTWGDVEAACEYWSKRIAWQFARQGVQLKPGATMPEEPTQSRTI